MIEANCWGFRKLIIFLSPSSKSLMDSLTRSKAVMYLPEKEVTDVKKQGQERLKSHVPMSGMDGSGWSLSTLRYSVEFSGMSRIILKI